MSQVMSIDDEVRLRVLQALLSKGGVNPNLKQIKKITGLHAATVKSSIEFLKSQGVLEGFGPKLNFRSLGYLLEVRVLFQFDMSKQDLFKKLLLAVEKDNHLFRLTSVMGSGNWNLYASFLYKDVESFHKNFSRNYEEKIPGFFDLIKDKQVFYTTEPVYKNASRTESVIKIIKNEKGFE
ncbi:MAG: Lrp/AsnC family transcriptional regulator [Candidatus Diapherotrites archaeon]